MMFNKILAIDDSEVVLTFHRFTLSHLIDSELITANNGAEGFKVLKENPDVDLILLDINMPLLDGVTFLRILRKEPGDMKKIPVVIISTESAQQDITEAMQAGATAYVTKPIQRAELIKTLERIAADRDGE